jgi:hypothetical protein
MVVLRSSEIWQKHSTLANVYVGMLFYPTVKTSLDDLEGVSVKTGAIKLIASDRRVVVAETDHGE